MKNWYLSENHETIDIKPLTKAQKIALAIGAIGLLVLILTSCQYSAAEPVRDITDTSRPRMFSDIRIDDNEDEPCPSVTESILDAQWDAICWMESRNTNLAHNKVGKAYGPAQITAIMLREFQRLTGRPDDIMPTLEDCYDEGISRMVFDTIILHHNPELDIYETAEIWHPGHSRKYMDGLLEKMRGE